MIREIHVFTILYRYLGLAPAPVKVGISLRLRRLELAVLGLTLAFVCFLGGYFTGLKSAVNIVSVSAQDEAVKQTDKIVSTVSIPATEQAVTEAVSPEAEKEKPNDAGEIVTKTPAPVGSPKDSDGRIDINLASRSELMDLPGIGNVLAERIVEYRVKNGFFKKIDDLRNVSGIGEKRFEAIKDKITVG